MTSSTVTVVITPAASRDLVELADLREQLQFKSTDTAQDAWLAKVISRASGQAERYCNRIFVQQGYQDVFGAVTCQPGAPLILAQAPATISTITADGTALDQSTFVVDADAGLVYPAGEQTQWTAGQSIIVAYTGGYEAIPYDVQMAVLDLCTIEYRGRTRDPMLRDRETPGLGRERFWVGPVPGQLLPADIGTTLDPYRRGGIG